MLFECEGRRYDTCDMDTYETGKAHEPFVYVTSDLTCVFVQTMDRNQGVGMHQASEAAIRRLWDCYGIERLLRVLAVLGRDPNTGQSRERQEHPAHQQAE